MPKTIFAALAVFILSSPARAELMTDADFASRLGTIRLETTVAGQAIGEGIALADKQAEPRRLIRNVMVAMYDAPGTGEHLVGWLRKNDATVEFSDLDDLKSMNGMTLDLATGNKTPAVYIHEKFSKKPVSYRYIGVLIAQEASKLMLADYPESAERAYMIAANMAHVYFELGGERINLPNFDGINDPEIAAVLRIWIENAGDGGVAVLSRRGHKPLAGLLKQARDIQGALKKERAGFAIELEAAKSQEEIDAIQAKIDDHDERIRLWAERVTEVQRAVEAFENFKRDDIDWIMAHQGQLR